MLARFDSRQSYPEQMDDYAITDERLRDALDELRGVNRWLGGYHAMQQALIPFLRACAPGQTVRVLDLGTGVADLPEHLVCLGARMGLDLHAVGVDANPATVAHAASVLDRRLTPRLRERVQVLSADALDLPFDDGAFDVVTASLFAHHLDSDGVVHLLREMQRLARVGLVVSDLHRHPLAYAGIRAVCAALPVSAMFRNDGPISVLRGFTGPELLDLARRAGLNDARLHWRWAFRWILTTMPGADHV